MVEIEVLEGLLNNLKSYVKELKRLSLISKNNFLKDPDKLGSAKYHLIIAIECCLDIAHHIIASENLRKPENFADTFTVLAENKILNPEISSKLESMARFRNLLVHLYSRVENEKIYEFLQEELADFDKFAQDIANFIQKND